MPCLADNFHCTGCLACVDACPTKALSKTINKDGHYTYVLNKSLCIECKKCERTCPVVSNYKYGNNTLDSSETYAGWNNNDTLRRKSSSGGVFSGIAEYILNIGGVVIGSTMEGFTARHIIVEDIESLYKLQGSKYTQSDTLGIFTAVKEKLSQGRVVLFSGLGCQIAALLSFLKESKYLNNLYTVDLICGGVPSSYLIKRFEEEYSPLITGIYSFRDKMKYALSVIEHGKDVCEFPLSKRPLPLCGFYTEMTNRYSCYNCQFALAHRNSDVTIGDFWGDKKFVKEHKKGLSVIIVHSQRGRELLEKSNLSLHKVEWKDFLIRNFRMVLGKQYYPKKVRANLAYAFNNYSYRKLQEEYGNTASIKQPFLFSRKIYRFLLRKIHTYMIGLKIQKILNR